MTRYEFYGENIYHNRRLVFKDGKYGFIDKLGNEVIPLKFDSALPFYSRKTTAVEIDGKYGAIDIDGNVVIPLQYSSISYKYPNLYEAEYDGKIKLLNPDGSEAYPQLFDKRFHDNRVCINGKYGLCSFNGEIKEIIPAMYDEIYDYNNNFIIVKNNGCYGVVDNNNNIILDTIYDKIAHCTIPRFDGEKEIFIDGFYINKDNMDGLADCEGNFIFEPIYKSVSFFHSTMYIVVDLNGNMGLFDLTGKEVAPIEFSSISCPNGNNFNVFAFSKGDEYFIGSVNGVQIPDSKTYSFIDPYFYNSMGVFKVSSYDEPQLFGIIDANGKEIISCDYDSIDIVSRSQSLLLAQKGDVKKYFDFSGKESICVNDFDNVEILENVFMVRKDNKYGLYDFNGEPITRIIYDDIRYNYMADIKVTLNGFEGYIKHP